MKKLYDLMFSEKISPNKSCRFFFLKEVTPEIFFKIWTVCPQNETLDVLGLSSSLCLNNLESAFGIVLVEKNISLMKTFNLENLVNFQERAFLSKFILKGLKCKCDKYVTI